MSPVITVPASRPVAGSANVRSMKIDATVRESRTCSHGIMPRMTIVISM